MGSRSPMGKYSATQEKENLPLAMTWMEPESTMLSKISQSEKDQYRTISLRGATGDAKQKSKGKETEMDRDGERGREAERERGRERGTEREKVRYQATDSLTTGKKPMVPRGDGGAGMAQLVKRLPSTRVMISGSWDLASSPAPCSLGCLLLPLPLLLPLLVLFLSLK